MHGRAGREGEGREGRREGGSWMIINYPKIVAGMSVVGREQVLPIPASPFAEEAPLLLWPLAMLVVLGG